MDLLIKQGYLYVAVFDADFKPEPGFLYQTIPYLEGNPSVSWRSAFLAVCHPPCPSPMCTGDCGEAPPANPNPAVS